MTVSVALTGVMVSPWIEPVLPSAFGAGFISGFGAAGAVAGAGAACMPLFVQPLLIEQPLCEQEA